MQQPTIEIETTLVDSTTYMALTNMLEVDLAEEREEESFTYQPEPFYIFDDITLPQEEVLF